MDSVVRSWLFWGTSLAAVAAGAWMLHDPGPTADTLAAAAGAASQLPAAMPTTTLAAPVTVPTTAADERFALLGMMTIDGANRAMIAVDGQRARMFRVGETLDGKWVLRAISANGAVIGPPDGGAAITLKDASPQLAKSSETTQPYASPMRDLSDGSAESAMILRKIGAKNAPQKAPSAAEQASAAEASVPTDPGSWRPPGQP